MPGGYGELTAEDVKFSYERIAGLTTPKLDSPYEGDWSPHLKEVIGQGQAVGHDRPQGAVRADHALDACRRRPAPILSKKAVEERGEKFATDPIGTGPYEFVSWKPKQQVDPQALRGVRRGLRRVPRESVS